MKTAVVFFLTAAATWAQDAKPVALTTPIAALPCVNGPKINPQSFTNLESRFDSSLNSLNDRNPIDLLGGTRALYLRDYGLTLTAEISLVQTPTINPFRKEISEAEKARIHQRKLDQLPRLKQAMRDMVKTSALTLAGAVGIQGMEGSGLQVAVSVKVLYLKWEDTTGLPGQMTMKGDLKNAIAGVLQEEDQ
jgi:hypothetical protein